MAGLLETYFMEPRPEWNTLGPRLPLWFRRRLEKACPNMALQFIPARGTVPKGGVDPHIYPHGVWIVCLKMKRTGWLHKRWLYAMAQRDDGSFLKPSMETIKLLRMTRDLSRRGDSQRMTDEFDRTCRSIKRERIDRTRCEMMRELDTKLSKMNHRQWTNRISMRQSVPA